MFLALALMLLLGHGRAQASVQDGHEHAAPHADQHASENADSAKHESAPEEHDHADHGESKATGMLSVAQWFGRLHPMVVHFPIALLLMAGLAELLLALTGKEPLALTARFCLWGGALGAFVAAPLGWAVATAVKDGYTSEASDVLFYHRWIGVATALVAGAALVACERSSRAPGASWRRTYRGFLALSILLVSVAGHLGASLIYGLDYLTP